MISSTEIPGNPHQIRLEILLQSIQEVTEAYYNYLFISLVAEFGGYVGLFLGVAIIQAGPVAASLVGRALSASRFQYLHPLKFLLKRKDAL